MSHTEEKFKQLTTRTKVVIILVFILGLDLAWMFRYSAPVSLGRGGAVTVTDRWTGCVTYHIYDDDEKPYTSCP